MKTIYIAHFEYGKANLTKAKLVRETPKTLFVEKAAAIMGRIYIPHSTRLSKEKYRFFFSGQEALAYLVSQAEKHVRLQHEKLEGAMQERDRLQCIIKEGESMKCKHCVTQIELNQARFERVS